MSPRQRHWPLLVTALWIATPDSARGQDAPASAADPDSMAHEWERTLSAYQVDEIVITGTRTHKKIIDVPYAIDRVDMADKKFERKVTVDDVLGDIPGLFLQSRYGNHDVRISIRGFGSRSNTGIRGVRILLDGIPESEPDGQTRIEAIDFQALGSIEVVKGNASSLYPNAPGGVINFISDLGFEKSHAMSFNQFGSFDLRQNGFKAGIKTDRYRLLSTYSYHNARGYRAHSDDFWHIANTVVETRPGASGSTLKIFTYYADGLIRLPGSLTKAQLDADPLQANERDVARDTKRITRKGRIGVRFETPVGDHEIELTGYATIKYFERTAATYRLFNRDGIGASARYVEHGELFGHRNEFSFGGDLFYQWGPVQEYDNINGTKGDALGNLTDERIGNAGVYVQNTFTLMPKRMDLLLSGRYDNVAFQAKDGLLDVRSARRRFEDFTPKAALNYKLTPTIAAYTSYGLGFDTPAGNELDNPQTSSNPNTLINPDLQPQHSKNFELGIKGGAVSTSALLTRVNFNATYFASRVDNEIVPFDVFGDVYFRNSATTRRAGLELGVDADVVAGLRLRGAYTLSDFTYDEYFAGTVEFDSLSNIVLAIEDFSGNTVPSVPKSNLSVSVAYEHDLADQVTAFAKASYSAISGMYVDDANSDRTEGYHLVDPLLGLDVGLGGVDVLLSAGASNLFDESYVGFVNINSTAKEFYEAGEPRSYFGGVNVGRRF